VVDAGPSGHDAGADACTEHPTVCVCTDIGGATACGVSTCGSTPVVDAGAVGGWTCECGIVSECVSEPGGHPLPDGTPCVCGTCHAGRCY
jgi:hypothetical protein